MLGILWAKFDMADIIGKSGATEICMLMADWISSLRFRQERRSSIR